MEHRCGARHRVRLVARLRLASGEVFMAPVRDLSLGGVFVELDPSCLPLRAIVGLELLRPGIGPVLRREAMVARHGRRGAGLVFDDYAVGLVAGPGLRQHAGPLLAPAGCVSRC
jgi:hypothetical protein